MDRNSRGYRRVYRLAAKVRRKTNSNSKDKQKIKTLREKVKRLEQERDYLRRLLTDKGVFPERSDPASTEKVECSCGEEAVLVNLKDERWIVCRNCNLQRKNNGRTI